MYKRECSLIVNEMNDGEGHNREADFLRMAKRAIEIYNRYPCQKILDFFEYRQNSEYPWKVAICRAALRSIRRL